MQTLLQLILDQLSIGILTVLTRILFLLWGISLPSITVFLSWNVFYVGHWLFIGSPSFYLNRITEKIRS